MLRCLDLAVQSEGKNLSNPMVGAVLVFDDKIIGEGYHAFYGGPHAEVAAISSVKEENRKFISSSILYVSLEPCSHHGKTPPCTELIIRSGIKKVVIGSPDPNPLVSGNGKKVLEEHGIEVVISKHRNKAEELLLPFLAHLEKMPRVILKCVKSKDNYIGQKDKSIWLSNRQTDVVTHMWRSENDAILVGKNTVMSDNPTLTTRNVDGKNPIRIVIDPNLECDKNAAVFSKDGKIIVYNRLMSTQENNITYVQYEGEDLEISFMLKDLFSKGILYLLVEGGAYTLTKFLESGYWHEARVINTPHLLTEGIKAPDIEGRLLSKTNLGDNTIFRILNKNYSPSHMR
ncbi:MAG: bifunctional diaminohydroxyphosphoribosylaminopyrimidine deaminase/5-amino-6-(5-phosphoribosylamino)uracil reductase RibD [Saprospiraceae bacterium]|nr:bifunctional diaminohydroxyphosphoribosylaminopyrimidine deaminase/5-amino-6-(5-phosphoribosylamino)uracil reductase RibD [Saprospiraceae bacterium]